MAKRKIRLTFGFLSIGVLFLFACHPIRVKIESEKPSPAKPPPMESLPSKPPSIETPQERPSPIEPPLGKTYTETVSKWKSYQDLIRWMEKDFSFDKERFRQYQQSLPLPRAPEETFRLKSGIYIDAATFAKETLNRIDPSYQARIVVIIFRPYGYNHYTCSFRKDGKLFIIDYGTPYKEVTGLQGPFNSLEDYRKFFEKNHPIKRHIEAVRVL